LPSGIAPEVVSGCIKGSVFFSSSSFALFPWSILTSSAVLLSRVFSASIGSGYFFLGARRYVPSGPVSSNDSSPEFSADAPGKRA